MAQEPVYERAIDLPFDYVVTLRATPATVRRTLLRLLPWALVAMTPGGGRRARIALAAARRLSPLVRLRLR
jgi:hypothetical protein